MRVAVNEAGGSRIDARTLRKTCRMVLKAEGARRDSVLSVTSLDRESMEAMNRRYLSREGPTDVLAFPMGEDVGGKYLLGDVIICPEIVAARAEDYRVPEGRELEFVTAHGILHLLGYEDEGEEESERMDRRAREILGLAGGEEDADGPDGRRADSAGADGSQGEGDSRPGGRGRRCRRN